MLWNRPTFAIVTGASKGIGEAIANQLSELVGPGSLLLLVARSENALLNLQEKIERSRPEIHVRIHAADLGLADPTEVIGAALAAYDLTGNNFQHAIIFHNAGSLGDTSKKAKDLDSVTEMDTYFRFNLYSAITWTSVFLKLMNLVPEKRVVNISSLCGVKPFKSFAFYCTGKAARDMYFKVLAEEEPSMRVLNYAPGPVATDMLQQITTESWDSNLQEMNKNMLATGQALQPNVTVRKLLNCIAKDDFQSGDHLDYYDIPDDD